MFPSHKCLEESIYKIQMFLRKNQFILGQIWGLNIHLASSEQ